MRLLLSMGLVLLASATQVDGLVVPLEVHPAPTATTIAWPVTAGVPFAQGVAPDAEALTVCDRAGTPTPSQVTALEKWPDGSLRWVWVDFIAQPGRTYQLLEGPRVPPAAPVTVKEVAGSVIIDTGAARYRFAGGGCFSQIELSGQPVVQDAGQGFYVIDSQGRRGVLQPDEVRVELRGPMRTVLRVAGSYLTADGQRNAGAVVYYHFFAGRPEVRIEHKLIVTENTNQLWFRDIGLTLPLATPGAAKATLAPGDRHELDGQPLILLQQTYPHFGKQESRFVVRRGETEIASGAVAGNWADLATAAGGIAAQVPAFAQTFPKAFVLTDQNLTVKLWAAEAGQELDFRPEKVLDWYFGADWIPRDNEAWQQTNNAQGTARTHDLWIYPHAGALDPQTLGAAAQPTLAKAAPEWIAASGALGPIHPYDPDRFPEVERAMDEQFDRAFALSEAVFPVNGYLYYRGYPWVAQPWELKEGQWYPTVHRLSRNLEYNFKRHIWIAAMRHPNRRYFDWARDYTRFQNDMLWSNAITEGVDTRGHLYQAFFHSPIVWAGRGAYLSYASSEDVIQFVYDYFFNSSYHSRDMAEAWIAQVKLEYGDDAAAAAQKQDRADSLLRMVGSAYELHHDPWLLKFSQAFTQYTVRPDSEVGLDLAESQIAKTGDVYSAYFFNWLHTRDPLALTPVKRFAQFDYRRGLLNFNTRSSAAPYGYALKYLQDHEQAFAAMLGSWLYECAHAIPSLAELGIERQAIRQGYTGNFGQGVFVESGPVFYGLPMAMAAVARAGLTPQPRPLAEQPQPTQRVYLLLKRPAAREDTLDLFVNDFGSRGHTVTLRNQDGQAMPLEIVTRDEHRVTKPAGVKDVQAFKEYYTLYGSLIFYQLRIPAAVPPGVYCLDLGEQVCFKLLNSTIARACVAAPDGLVLRAGHQYFFPLPAGIDTLHAFAHRPVVITDPDGQPLEPSSADPRTGAFTVKLNGRGGVYRVHSVADQHLYAGITSTDTFFRLHNAPLVLALDDPARLFEVDPARYPSTEQRDPDPAPANGVALRADGRFGGSVLLNYRALEIPTDAAASHAPRGTGTVEFWWRPHWSAGDASMAQSTQRLYLFHMEPVGLMYFVDNPNAGRTPYYNDSRLDWYVFKPGYTRARFYPTAGVWYHVAATWNIDGRDSQLDLYINGRKKFYAHYVEGLLRNTPLEQVNAIGELLRFGSARFAGAATGGDEFDELRVSRTVRYTEDFEPPAQPFTPDDDTWLLMHFDGDLKAQRDHQVIEATITTERRLF